MQRAACATLPYLLAAGSGACSSTSKYVPTLELRGALASSADVSEDLPIGPLAQAGSGPSGEIASGGGNVEWRSYGLRASLNMAEIDLIAGIDRHDYIGQDSGEVCLGLRKRFSESDLGGLYLEAALRGGFGLDTVAGQRDYGGMETTLGAILDLDQRWFINFGCTVEWTFDAFDLGQGEERLSDVLFSVGIGLAL